MSSFLDAARDSPLTPRVRMAFQGLIGALLCWFLWKDMGLLDLLPYFRGAAATMFGAAALGVGLGLTRARALISWGVAASLMGWSVVAWSPLSAACARPLILAQAPARADAVVVLLAHIQPDDDFGNPSLERLMRGLELMRAGLAPRLILTQGYAPQGSHRAAATKLLRGLGISYPMSVLGPVRDTHDEALAVGRLAREKGWKRILLVTSPLHSRRASAVFARAGVEVIATPCREAGYDLDTLPSPGARLRAFDAAIHEIVGMRIYRARGWIS